jgi:crotonobetainyl-CoA:carnitine CoA-transferase CaiB-like acyl-CoA transferase
MAARKENEAALDAIIAEAVRHRDQVELERELQAAGVAACRVNKAFALADDPGLRHFGFFQEIERPVTGCHPQKTWPFRFPSIDASHKRPAPLLGEHNAEVLRELAGLTDQEIRSLAEKRIIGESPLAAV